MAFYLYQAFSREGKKVNGRLDATSIQAARDLLSQQGLYPVSVLLQTTDNFSYGIFSRFLQPSMTLQEKVFFTKKLAVLLRSGIALTDVLTLMIDQAPVALRGMITKLRDELKEGSSFAAALSLYPNNFPPLYIQLVRAGEASGQMEKVLNRLAYFLEEQAAFNQAISSAIRGPLIQLGLVFIIAGFLLTLIVPKIADVFKGVAGKALPSITVAVLALSDALLHHYHIIGIVAVIVSTLYIAWSHSSSGKFIIDTIKLKLPIIKYVTRMRAVIQFAQTLGLLLESGVNIAEALDIVVQIVDNQILVNALKKARDNIIKQGKVTEYLQKTALFSSESIHLIGTGEQSGSLDIMLMQVGNYSQEELSEFMRGITTLLNPLSMLILAGVVGTIIFAIMAPIMDLANSVS